MIKKLYAYKYEIAEVFVFVYAVRIMIIALSKHAEYINNGTEYDILYYIYQISLALILVIAIAHLRNTERGVPV